MTPPHSSTRVLTCMCVLPNFQINTPRCSRSRDDTICLLVSNSTSRMAPCLFACRTCFPHKKNNSILPPPWFCFCLVPRSFPFRLVEQNGNRRNQVGTKGKRRRNKTERKRRRGRNENETRPGRKGNEKETPPQRGRNAAGTRRKRKGDGTGTPPELKGDERRRHRNEKKTGPERGRKEKETNWRRDQNAARTKRKRKGNGTGTRPERKGNEAGMHIFFMYMAWQETEEKPQRTMNGAGNGNKWKERGGERHKEERLARINRGGWTGKKKETKENIVARCKWKGPKKRDKRRTKKK